MAAMNNPEFDGVEMMRAFSRELESYQEPYQEPSGFELNMEILRLTQVLAQLSNQIVELTEENSRLRRRRFLWWLR